MDVFLYRMLKGGFAKTNHLMFKKNNDKDKTYVQSLL